jgi:hypothetical protein
MGRWKQGRAVAGVLLALAGGLIFTASAAADQEPNDVISFAEGPVAGGVPVTGTLGTTDDDDFFVFYAASQQQLHLTWDDLTSPSEDNCMEVDLLDTYGSEISHSYTTPPGVNRYFVHVYWDDDWGDCNTPINYRFELDPGTAVTTGAAMDKALSQTSEPNETVGQAIGPLGPYINYVGATETTNDEDWFWFWVPAGTNQLDIATTAPAGSCGSRIRLYSDPDNSVQSAWASQSSFDHIIYTVTGPAKYYISASSDDSYDCALGSRWQFRIETPNALSATDPFPPPPPPPPPAPPAVVQDRYPTSATLRRRGARYSGRVTSSLRSCASNRRVVLRRRGSGTKSYGSARTRSNGTFTIRRSKRLRGRVYVTVVGRSSATILCRSTRSRQIRG